MLTVRVIAFPVEAVASTTADVASTVATTIREITGDDGVLREAGREEKDDDVENDNPILFLDF